MTFRRFLPAVAVLAALTLPSAAHAAAPWSDPVAVPGSQGQPNGAADVLLTRTRGGAVAFSVGPSFPGTTLDRSLLDGALAPQPAAQWPNGTNVDSSFGSFATGDRLIYAGSNGAKRVLIATAAGPQSGWTTSLRGPTTAGSHIATAATPHGGAAAVFGTFQSGGGSVYLVRQPGTSGLQPTQTLSGRGAIRSVAVAVNSAGDVLAAWDRSGKLEARFWIASSRRLTAVQELGTTDVASHLSVALGSGRRAIVAWVDQRVSEGGAAKGKVMATARSSSRGFLLGAKQLDTYGVNQLAGGIGIKAAYTGNGMGLIAWSGNSAVRAARVDSRLIRTPQDLAPVPAGSGQFGLGDLATSADSDRAVVTWTAPAGAQEQNQASVWPTGGSAFGPVETLSGTDRFVSRPTAAFDAKTNTIVTAWSAAAITNGAPGEVDVAQRPAP